MNFSINRDALLEPLLLVSGVVERRQTMPVLSNLLCVCEEGRLVFTGTDQEVELSASSDLEGSPEPGEITVPARKLVDICRSLPPDATIQLSLEENRVSIRSGRFKSYLSTLPASEFPKVEMTQSSVGFSMPGRQLKHLLDRTSFAMAQQDVRYFLNGMLLETEGETIRSVATNGQCLATCEVATEQGLAEKNQFIVPRKGVIELGRLIKDGSAEPVELRLSANHLQVAHGHASLTSKLIDGTYPDYEKAIPAQGNKKVIFDRLEMREALSRIAILSNEMYRNVSFKLSEGKIELHANNPQQEEAEETVNVDYEGEALNIGFNVSYLIDVLSTLEGEKVACTLTDADTAALLTDSDDMLSRFVVSPMML